MGRSWRIAALLVGWGLVAHVSRADDFDAWVLTRGQILVRGHAPEARLPVGSLQKPFLVRAWALSHPKTPSPTFTCTRTSGCWRPQGHGTLDLRGALRESCNTYFRLLARETPRDAIEASLRQAGFSWKGEMTEAETIGLPGFAAAGIEPARLLTSYVDLARTPWPDREDVHEELLAGMRDSAEEGTASGVALRGFLAKTGTVPALDGTPLMTSGLALVLDDAGFAFLGLLRRGTGREAAIRAGAEILKLRPGSMIRPSTRKTHPAPQRPQKRRGLDDPVRVALFGELNAREVRLGNVGRGPVDSTRGFVGPGAVVEAVPGDHFSEGAWRIDVTKPALERLVRASIDVMPGDGPLRLIATLTARNYANGVLKAELGQGPAGLRTDLASAALRFVSRGPRHANADVCDSTHCAWFVGEGPVPRWLRPEYAVNEKDIAQDLSDEEWEAAVSAARAHPRGPDLWTADCGGEPVSPHFIWGGGDRRVLACARHPKGSGRMWRREWPDAEISALFGGRPDAMDVILVDGQWFLRIRIGSARPIALTYDDAHRRLASRLGWDAMPAPAARISRTHDGFVAEGVGSGHRVGLCLGK